MKTIATTMGNFTRLSDWIAIYHLKVEEGWVSYFDFDGAMYAMDEIIKLGNPWSSVPQHLLIDADGSPASIVGVEATSYLHPIYIEVDEYRELVRVYERA